MISRLQEDTMAPSSSSSSSSTSYGSITYRAQHHDDSKSDIDDFCCMTSPRSVIPSSHQLQQVRSHPKNKSVTFDTTTLVYPSLPLTPEEVETGWYSEAEMFILRCTAKDDISYIQTVGHVRATLHHADDDNFCVRGLENRLRNYDNNVRKSIKQSSINLVLQSQEMNYRPESIAYLYNKEGFQLQAAATETGKQDELVAQQLWPWEEL